MLTSSGFRSVVQDHAHLHAMDGSARLAGLPANRHETRRAFVQLPARIRNRTDETGKDYQKMG